MVLGIPSRNNGTKRLNENLKYDKLQSSLSEVLVIFVNSFIPKLQKRI